MSLPDDPAGLLALLRSRDVRLRTDGVSLHYDAPAGALTDELLGALRRCKPALVAELLGAAPAGADGVDGGVVVGGDDDVVLTMPASQGQARQYRLTLASDNPSLFTIAQRFPLHGRLSPDALARALAALVVRHPALRTRYHVRGGQVLQQVMVPRPVPLPVTTADEAELDAAIVDWAAQPFALEAEPPFRALLVRCPRPAGEDEHWELVLAMHHGFSDGWSVTVLVRDLAELYRAELDGEEPRLPVLAADYAGFVRWEREQLANPATVRAVRGWADRVRPGLVPPALPADRPRPERMSNDGGVVDARLPADLVAAVHAYAAHRAVTPFAVLTAAFCWLVHGLTGVPTVPLTCPVANRVDARFDDVVGLFAHSLWLMVPVRGATTFGELVDAAAGGIWQLLALQSVPLEVQNDALGDVAPDLPRIYFFLLTTPECVLQLPGVRPAPVQDVILPGARSEQAWELYPAPGGELALVVEYSFDLYDAATVSSWAGRYQALLRALLASPDAPLPAPA